MADELMTHSKKTGKDLSAQSALELAPSAPKPMSAIFDKADPEEPQYPTGTETLLFVDDEQVILEVNRDILEFLGYRVMTAQTGWEAVEIYRRRKDEIALVIQDMVMPGMNGAEIFQALKEINPDVKVILASGYVMNKQIDAVMRQGCRAFMQKPFRLEDLACKVREILDSP